MGSTIRFNDTLQITAEQGFPAALDISQHLNSPLQLAGFEGSVFSFHGKEGIRNFQQPPVRNFLVQNYQGKHIYWGLISIVSISHDYLNNETSGQYTLYSIYSPEQMRMAVNMTGIDPALDYFSGLSG